MLEAAGRLLGSNHHTSAVIEFFGPRGQVTSQFLNLLFRIVLFRCVRAEDVYCQVPEVTVVIGALFMIFVPFFR